LGIETGPDRPRLKFKEKEMIVLHGSKAANEAKMNKPARKYEMGDPKTAAFLIAMLIVGGLAAGPLGIIIVIALAIASKFSFKKSQSTSEIYAEHLKGMRFDYQGRTANSAIFVDVANSKIAVQQKYGRLGHREPTTFILDPEDIREWYWNVEGYTKQSLITNSPSMAIVGGLQTTFANQSAEAQAVASSGLFFRTKNIEYPQIRVGVAGVGHGEVQLLRKWEEVLNQLFEGTLQPQAVPKVIK
jgi:hypothetical protein